MKKVLILLILVFMFSASSCTKGENKNEKGFVKALNTIDDQFTYAYIYDLIYRLRADSMKIDEELAIQAIRDAFKDSAKINPAIRQQIILAMQDSIRDRSIAKSIEQSKNLNAVASKIQETQKGFLDRVKLSESLKSTPSGILYKIIKDGNGKAPSLDDILEVNIIGTFADGTEFDNTYKTGKTLNFPATGLFKGWGEAMSYMKEGGKGKFYFPPELAFGAQGAPPKIPGDAVVIFEVEIIKLNGKYDPNKLKEATRQK